MREIKLSQATITGNISNERERILRSRDEFVKAYCAEKGWDMADLTIEQILEIREQPGWKEPG